MDADTPLPSDVGDCLARLAAGDLSARDRIIDLCSDRIRHLARRMLARFPNVRRWDDTDDVFYLWPPRVHSGLEISAETLPTANAKPAVYMAESFRIKPHEIAPCLIVSHRPR